MTDLFNTLKEYDRNKDTNLPTKGSIKLIDGDRVSVLVRGSSTVLKNVRAIGNAVAIGQEVVLTWERGIPTAHVVGGVPSREQLVSFSQGAQGPAGPAGPTGPTGPTGPAGSVSAASSLGLTELSTSPGAPAAGTLLVYAKTDHKVYKKSSDGTETEIGTGGGSGFASGDRIDQSGGTSDTYGVLSGTLNGTNTTFTVSEGEFVSGTLKVYLNGQLQTQGTSEDWVETNSGVGQFDFNTAPVSTDQITVIYKVASGNSEDADTLDGYHANSFVLASKARELLTADRTYYVRTDGSDSNNGLADSAAGAFLTAAKANQVVATIDKNGYNIKVKFGAGTWNEDVVLNYGTGDGIVTWEGTLTALETVTSATVAEGSAGTAGTVTKTGAFTGDDYSKKLAYFVTDDVYRVIYTNGSNGLTLADLAPSSTTQDVIVYDFGTVLDSIQLVSPNAPPTLRFLEVTNNSSEKGFSLEIGKSCNVKVYNCHFSCTFCNGGDVEACEDSVFDTTLSNTLISASYGGAMVIDRCLVHSANTSGKCLNVSRSGYTLVKGGTYDGNDGSGGKATYGLRSWGSATIQPYAPTGYGYIKVKNCDYGLYADHAASIMSPSVCTFSGCATNQYADSSTYGVIG